MKSFLFVYGTLHPDYAPAEMRAVVKFLRPAGKATARGTLLDLGNYPGAIFQPDSQSRIRGSVFRLPCSVLEQQRLLHTLDAYEGVDPINTANGLYVRMKTQVTLKNGKLLGCWAYEYNRDIRSLPMIPHGTFSR